MSTKTKAVKSTFPDAYASIPERAPKRAQMSRTTSKPTAARGKKQPFAHRVYMAPADFDGLVESPVLFTGSPDLSVDRMTTLPVAVVRLDDLDGLVERAAIAISIARNWNGAWENDCRPTTREGYRSDARAALRAIGIPLAKEKRK